MIDIIITDDHPIVRQGLKLTLGSERDICVKGEAGSGGELLELLGRCQCDVVLLDISLPGRSGIDVLQDVRALHPKVHVLILSMHSEDQFAVRAFRLGAVGYLTKGSPPGEIAEAIRKVHRGGRYVSPSLAEKLACVIGSNASPSPHDALSNREYQVLLMLASGKTVMEIARMLSLSDKTISTYRARILEKMQLKNNAELMHYAMSNCLVERL